MEHPAVGPFRPFARLYRSVRLSAAPFTLIIGFTKHLDVAVRARRRWSDERKQRREAMRISSSGQKEKWIESIGSRRENRLTAAISAVARRISTTSSGRRHQQQVTINTTAGKAGVLLSRVVNSFIPNGSTMSLDQRGIGEHQRFAVTSTRFLSVVSVSAIATTGQGWLVTDFAAASLPQRRRLQARKQGPIDWH